MEMPDNVLLLHLNLRSAFLDVKSEEEGTSIIKAKYKLLTQKDTILSEVGVYIFHVLTTTKDSYIKEKTIDIRKTDWEYINGTYLDAECSKLCTQEIDVMNKEKILFKIRDNSNKFSHAGILSRLKFNEVVDFVKKGFEKTDTKTNFEVRDIIMCLINKEKIAEELLNKFGI